MPLKWYTTRYDHGDPTDAEQYMLESINRARANPVAEAAQFNIDLNEGLDPGEIEPSPQPPLAFNKFLIEAARGHSQWMIDTDTVNHNENEFNFPGARMQAAGYKDGIGESENLALVPYSGNPGDLGQSVAEAHQSLFVDEGQPSKGHRKNILTHNCEVGIGVKVGDYQGQQSALVTQDYASSITGPKSFLVGVVYFSSAKGLYKPGLGVGGCSVMPSEGETYAITSLSGGYAIPIDKISGSVTITFDLGFWKAERHINIEGVGSRKVDWQLPWAAWIIWIVRGVWPKPHIFKGLIILIKLIINKQNSNK